MQVRNGRIEYMSKIRNDISIGHHRPILCWSFISRTAAVFFLAFVVIGCAGHQHNPPFSQTVVKPTCERIVTADVVALEQVYYYNRFGSFNPAGIMYALRRDVVRTNKTEDPEILNEDLDGDSEGGDPIPLKPSSADQSLAGNVKLRSDKRPRPLVLRANEGDCLQVTFTNLLSPTVDEHESMIDPERRLTHADKPVIALADSDEPATRHASMHVNGLSLVDSIDSQGANIGRNPSSLAAPGETKTYTWYAKQEGTYFFYSMAAPAGGEGDGGQVGLGLFGAVNVQPKGAKSYRSQVTDDELKAATKIHRKGEELQKDEKIVEQNRVWTKYDQPVINYEAVHAVAEKTDIKDEPRRVYPILNMLRQVGRLQSSKPGSDGKPMCKVGTLVNSNNELPWDGTGEPICLVPTVQTYEVESYEGEPRCSVGDLVNEEDQKPWDRKSKPICVIPVYEIVHSDLNAVIDIDRENGCERMGEGNACGKPYREFTVIFHDEVTAVQAFDDIREENSPLSSLRDGMGINYGASGLGAMVVANKKQLGPARDCAECKLEEFFLTSWVNGDPAMVVGYQKEDGKLIQVGETTVKGRNGKLEKRPLYKMKAKYPDDPSNVHHSYLGDPIRFRNMHAGPKETHVFHLHAHQWVEDKHDPMSHYLDSQTISPGTAFSYEVHYGGSGNRNLGPGDSIFHCHLYPHFAQGMWELWRTHDVFENGSRRLKDYDIKDGTPIPAVVPLPRTAMPPMPNDKFPGYPFYMAGEIGHRPPQPPLDLDGADDAGTLRRHIITDATVRDNGAAHGPKEMRDGISLPENDLYDVGRKKSEDIAKRVWSQNSDEDLIGLARELETAKVEKIASKGNALEVAAMKFHAGKAEVHGEGAVGPGEPGWVHTAYNWEAPGYRSCLPDGTCDDKDGTRVLFSVNGGGNIGQFPPSTTVGQPGDGVPGAPFSNPCPKQWVDEKGVIGTVKTRQYRAVYIQMDMAVNKSGWHDPQARFPVLEKDVRDTLEGKRPTEPLFFRAQSGECVEFYATNLIPSNLNLDDFQVYSPTDTIGQHIHLVKFDVTSSDGSGNGWNYEDGTLAADEVRERIEANNKLVEFCGTPQGKKECPKGPPAVLHPKTHPIFLRKGELGAKEDGALAGDKRGYCADVKTQAVKYKEAIKDRKGNISREELDKITKIIDEMNEGNDDDLTGHPWCGAQTTIQRWWADPILNGKPGEKHTKDRTMRTVFTHDHFGPSSHQHHGFYAALVIEPTNSKWYFPDGRLMGGTDAKGNPEQVQNRKDGGPTSYAANIIVRDRGLACLDAKKDGTVCSEALDSKGTIDYKRTGREFNLAFADFAIVYDKHNQPINPPSQIEGGLESPVRPGRIPMPEGISTKDPGTQLINYRNEPIPLRIGIQDKEKNQFVQLPESDQRSDLANVFSSNVHKDQKTLNEKIFTEKEVKAGKGRQPGDPATPLLRAYEGDHVQIRLIQGAQEEQHIFTLHGAKWLAQPDSPNTGYVGSQHIGISEHFEFNDRVVEFMPAPNSNNGLPQVDHLYMSNATDNLWDGQWGLMRVYSRKEVVPQLARLPGNTEKTHDVLASAFVKEVLSEALDSERLEASDENGLEPQHGAQDALEVFCESEAKRTKTPTPIREYQVEAWLAKDLLLGKKLVYNEHFGISDPQAILFVQASDVPKFKSDPTRRPEPLILRARAGECIRVKLTNKINPEKYKDGKDYPETWSFNMVPPITPGLYFNQVRSSHRVGLHPQLVDYNLQKSDGARVGLNDDSTVGPDETKTYLWYAGEIVSVGEGRKNRIEGRPHEFGAIPLQDMGDVIKHASHGAIGALIIEPQCSQWDEKDDQPRAEVTVTYWRPEADSNKHGKRLKKQICPLDETWTGSVKGYVKAKGVFNSVPVDKMPEIDSGALYRFKEMVLLYQDNLSLQQYGQPMPNLRNGDDSEDSGQKAFNYRTEPLWARLGASPADEPETMNHFDWSDVLSSRVSHFRCNANIASGKYCDPETPIFTAKAEEQIRFRVVHPGGHPRQHGFTLFGHDWSLSPWIDNSKTMGWNQYSAARVGSTGGIGPGRAINIMASAGGDCAVHRDYLYRTQEGFMFGGGLWGIFRVEPAEKRTDEQKDQNACKVALPKIDGK